MYYEVMFDNKFSYNEDENGFYLAHHTDHS